LPLCFLFSLLVGWLAAAARASCCQSLRLTEQQDAQKMNVFLGFIFNEQTLNKWLKDEWCERCPDLIPHIHLLFHAQRAP
jgi:hypothetical protein